MAEAKIFEENGGFSAHSSLSVQTLTLDSLKAWQKSFEERLDEIFEKFFVQTDNNDVMLEEEKEEVTQVKAPEYGKDVSQIMEKLMGLKEVNPEIWREIYSEVLKVPGEVWIFKISRGIRNGTLQFLYKNGLLILIKKGVLFKGNYLASCTGWEDKITAEYTKACENKRWWFKAEEEEGSKKNLGGNGNGRIVLLDVRQDYMVNDCIGTPDMTNFYRI